MTDCIPESQLLSNDQCFPLYVYNSDTLSDDLFSDSGDNRSFAISEATLDRYRKKFGKLVSEEDIFYYVYGVLNHPDYVRKYKNELGKGLPRIPMVSTFHELVALGSSLGSLHVNYEMLSGHFPPGLAEFKKEETPVERIRFDKVNGVTDKTRLIINSSVLITDLPEETDLYQLSGRSALELIIDRYEKKTDKSSGILQDPNAFSSSPTYVTELIAKVIEVSTKHVELLSKAPKFV
jgi:predicted helicase